MTLAAEWTPWETWPPSTLSHHGEECCASAQAWFHAMSRSMWRGDGGPVWIRRDFDWGPTCWPIHWCEAMDTEEFCCGAHSALGVEAFRARGKRAEPAQLIQRYDAHNVPHWRDRWAEGGASPEWAQNGLVYHEACAVITDGRVEIWNATASSWVSPEDREGYASIVALRVGGTNVTGEAVTWGELQLPLGTWVSAAAAGPAQEPASPRAMAPFRMSAP